MLGVGVLAVSKYALEPIVAAKMAISMIITFGLFSWLLIGYTQLIIFYKFTIKYYDTKICVFL